VHAGSSILAPSSDPTANAAAVSGFTAGLTVSTKSKYKHVIQQNLNLYGQPIVAGAAVLLNATDFVTGIPCQLTNGTGLAVTVPANTELWTICGSLVITIEDPESVAVEALVASAVEALIAQATHHRTLAQAARQAGNPLPTFQFVNHSLDLHAFASASWAFNTIQVVAVPSAPVTADPPTPAITYTYFPAVSGILKGTSNLNCASNSCCEPVCPASYIFCFTPSIIGCDCCLASAPPTCQPSCSGCSSQSGSRTRSKSSKRSKKQKVSTDSDSTSDDEDDSESLSAKASAKPSTLANFTILFRLHFWSYTIPSSVTASQQTDDGITAATQFTLCSTASAAASVFSSNFALRR
jgi:hypothetical protein